MGWKITLGLIFVILTFFLLFFYWFFPLSSTEFTPQPKSSGQSFQLGQIKSLQFYENMRYPESTISYNIGDCTIAKRDEAIRALNLLQEKTILRFYPVAANEEISITCDSRTKIEGGFFIAGEGGPTNITKAGEFNVISKGTVLLIRESQCKNPNVGVHEILHALGFNHTANPDDIMYPISSCSQEIQNYTIDLINSIYSIPPYPDLVFENVSAIMKGKYLDANMSIRNDGFEESSGAIVQIYADDSLIKEVNLDSLDIGHGIVISLRNIWIGQFNTYQLRFFVKTNFDELKKDNNEVILKIKK
ncbi:MAG: matrixin family metalloprotease [Nanoarchaeota archaeon]